MTQAHPSKRRTRLLAPLAWAALGVLGALPLGAGAACTASDPKFVRDYEGTLDDKQAVRLSLVFDGDRVEGLYFHVAQLKDIVLRGRRTQGLELALEELDAGGAVTARFMGRFAEHDPKGKFGKGPLQCEVIVGTWSAADGSGKVPFYFNQMGMLAGSLTNRYGAPGGDESIHRAASQFRDAVAQGDRKAVASFIRYPITVRAAGGKIEVRNDRALVANYAAIFTPKFRELIAGRVPRQLMRSSEGMMFGRGEVYFDEQGKVFALNPPPSP